MNNKEKMFQGTLIVSDLDGTLFNSNCKISRENREAIHYFTERGGLFTACTGRMLQTLAEMRDLLNVPAIFLNGSAIYSFQKEKVLWNAFLDKRVEWLLEDLMGHFADLAVEIYTNHSVYVYSYSNAIEHHRSIEYFEVNDIKRDFTKIPDRNYTKLVLTDVHERLVEVEHYLQGQIKKYEFPFVMEYSLPEFLEFRSAYGGKGNALKHLSTITGMPLSDIVAIGDNMNDLPLFSEAGYKIAVGNAVPQLKKIADVVVCDHEHHAMRDVVKVLEERIVNNGQKMS